MTQVLGSLDFKLGNSNGSGIDNVFVASKDWITAWPTIDDDIIESGQNPTTQESYTTYTGSFTMASGKTFIRAYQVQGEGEGTAEGTGDRDSMMFMNGVKFRFPKLTQPNLALQKAIINGDVVVVFWHDGHYHVVGHKHYRSEITVNTTTGAAAGSSKGTTYEVKCPDYAPLPVYVGTIALPDGSLNCETDVFSPTGSSSN